MLVGGTGLYYSSLIDNISFADEDDDASIRSELERRAESEGIETLHRELSAIDPETAAQLHLNNRGRIIRALEVYYKTGVTMSEQQRRQGLLSLNMTAQRYVSMCATDSFYMTESTAESI